MATLLLRQTWINLMSTGEGIGCYTGRGRSGQAELDGEVRRYAGGRFRAISTEGVRRMQSFAVRDVPQATITKMEGWLGETVCVRDTRGRKMFGVFFGIAHTDRAHKAYYDVSLQVEEVSFVEGG